MTWAPLNIDGVDATESTCDDTTPHNWSDPGILDNTFNSNVSITTTNETWEYRSDDTDDGIDDTNTQFSGNTVYTTRAEAASDNGWPDPERTLKTYLTSLGYAVSISDGFMEFFDLAVQQRKGDWDDNLTAHALNNYIRQGFGMAALP